MSLPENDDDLIEVDIETLPEDQQTAYRDALIARWEARKSAQEAATEAEYAIRDKLVELLWTPGVLAGKEKVELYNGFKLEIEKKKNYNVDQNLVRFVIDKWKNGTPEQQVIADRLFRWKAELSSTEYKALSDEQKQDVASCLSVSYSRAAVKIVSPPVSKGRMAAKPGAGI